MTRRILLGALALVLVASTAASASTFVAVSQDELVRQADAVLQGRVAKVSQFWNAEGTMIYTEAVIEVQEKLVGDTAGIIVVRTFGGTVGSYTVEAHGFPEFREGERTIMFVKALADGAYEVEGYRQGQFRVMRDRTGKALAIPMVEDGVAYLDAQGRGIVRKIQPLDTFKAQLRESARAAGRLAQ
jgi:hypothetical protein